MTKHEYELIKKKCGYNILLIFEKKNGANN